MRRDGEDLHTGARLRCIADDDYPWRAEPSYRVGDVATLRRAEDYCPGLDAGSFDLDLDAGGHVAYWTRDQTARYWERIS